MKEKADIGLIGLAVMGENLVLNMESKGFTVAVFNRTTAKVDAFLADRGRDKNFIGCHSLAELCAALVPLRKIMMLVKAGAAVDELITRLTPLLEPGDILIDGGNSHFTDTIRRAAALRQQGLRFVGSGVSGGEEGALRGPSLMPGGDVAAWPFIQPIFQAIAAHVDGEPCCDWVGSDGAGHFVKMVHNGIEYGDMQMIGEAYSLLKNHLGLSNPEMRQVFTAWNRGELDSYLIEITTAILGEKDPVTGRDVIDVVLDAAGQKGTGKWTGISALELGAVAPTLTEAVFARCVSALKEERIAAAAILPGPTPPPFTGDRAAGIEDIRRTLYAAKICSYAQGYQLMRRAAAEYGWQLDYGKIALMWRGGCIIRAKFLGAIKTAFERHPALPNLLLDDFFRRAIADCQVSWRRVVAMAASSGIPVPTFSSALTYYDSYRAAELPANLLQCQRDYFGAHTYERTDRPRGQFFHTDWCRLGGHTTSGSYEA
ncbi:MAG: decarboxylating NADP(+)-dependent phosphogluconate dehydrogenase [Victivallales bacterium]|nr:decarboxylating NADP(+)-dependent phosphogluconate dehydrogenase [Victivallales bacterium]